MLGFKEWTETRKPFYWVKLFSMMPRSFQHIGLNKYEFEGQVIEFPPGDTPDTDRHQAYAYLAGYLKWCRKHDQEPGPFEDLVDSPSVEDL